MTELALLVSVACCFFLLTNSENSFRYDTFAILCGFIDCFSPSIEREPSDYVAQTVRLLHLTRSRILPENRYVNSFYCRCLEAYC